MSFVKSKFISLHVCAIANRADSLRILQCTSSCFIVLRVRRLPVRPNGFSSMRTEVKSTGRSSARRNQLPIHYCGFFVRPYMLCFEEERFSLAGPRPTESCGITCKSLCSVKHYSLFLPFELGRPALFVHFRCIQPREINERDSDENVAEMIQMFR